MRSSKKYHYLPKSFRNKHDYCEFVINQIEDLILNDTFKELKTQSINFPEDFIEKIKNTNEDLFDLLERDDYIDELNHIVRTQLIYSLIIETCYFIQESLQSSLKMRMTVCFTLLRKPFLEISIILMRILNEDDFIDKFNKLEKFDPSKTTHERKRELIALTNQLLHNKYPEDELFDDIYNKEIEDSLYNLTNNAIHLYTHRNPATATGKQNLNFIFSNQEHIESQWEYVYETLPMLITFIADLFDLLTLKSTSVQQDIFIKRIKKRDKLKTKNNVC